MWVSAKMRITILVIDDDEDILFIAQKCLKAADADFSIIPATNAQEALRLIETETIDAIICDFYLGPEKMNGLELLEWLREEGLTTPFIIFTGRSREEIAIQALNLGADYYLEKSTDLEGLFAEIYHHIRNVVRSKRTEEALRESEQRYRTLVNSIDDMIFVLDGNDCFSDYHSPVQDDLLKPPQNFLGVHISDVLPEFIYQLYLEKAPIVRTEKKRQSFDYKLMNRGQEKWYEAHMDLHEDDISIVVIVRNITERVQHENEIIEAERRWRETFNSIPDFISVHDADSRIVKVNQSLAYFLGMPKEEILGRKCYEVLHNATEPPENCPYVKTIANETTASGIVADPRTGCPLFVTTSPIFDEKGIFSGVIHIAKDITEEIAITKELEESEKRFRAVFENAGIGMTIVDVDDNILHTNVAFQKYLGFTLEELKQTKVADFTHPEDVQIDAELFQEILDGKRDSYRMEKRYFRKNGDQVWGDLVTTIVRNTQGEIEFISGMIADITQKKRFEEQLKDDEIRFKLIFENAPIGFALVDVVGRIFMSNKALADMLGYSVMELEQLNIKDFTHPEDWRIEKNLDLELLEGRSNSYTLEKRYRRKDGEEIWGRLSVSVARNEVGKPQMIIGMVEDITKEREVTQKILQSEQNLLSLFDSVDEYVWIIGLDGKIIDVNDTVVRNLGYAKEELIGQPAVIVHPAERRDEAQEILLRMLDGKETICPVPLCTKSQQIVEVDTVVTQGHWNNEEVLFGVSRDVTIQREYLKMLRENEQKYRALFEKTHDAVYIISLEGNVLDLNEQAELIFNCRAEDVIGKPCWISILPESREGIVNRIDELITTGSLPRFEQAVRSTDGRQLNLEISAFLVSNLEGEPIHIQCIVRDVSNEKSQMVPFESSEKKHQMIVESMSDMIFIFDNQDRYSEYYTSTSHLLYTPPDDFLGKHIVEVMPLDIAQSYLDLSQKVRTTGNPETYEYNLQINGETQWFDSSLSLHEDGKSIVCVVRDITERKCIEIENIEQNRFLEKVIESLPHPFYVIDAADFSIKLANQVAKAFTEPGVSACYQITHNRDLPCTGIDHPCPLKHVKETKKPFIVDHQHVDKDGRKRDIEVHGYPILDKDENVIEMIEYGIDVTEHKQALRALEKSERRFRELFEKAPLGYQTLDQDGKILDVNDAWLEKLGYTRNQVIGRNFADFLYNPSEDDVLRCFNGFKERDFMGDCECEMIKGNGSRLIAHFNCQASRNEADEFQQTHCIFQDITEWKKAEAIIRMEHDKAQTYLDIAGVIIVALDLDGNVTLLNQKGSEITGYSENELIGKNWFDDMIPIRMREESKLFFKQIFENPLGSYEHAESVIVTKNGSERIINWHNSILRDENGTIIGTLSSGEDITQRKIADDLLKKQRDELSELAHVMSHDIGNKLKSINTLINIFKKEHDEEILDRISNISIQSTQLLQTSAELADAGVIIQIEEKVNLETVVREIAAAVLPDTVSLITNDLETVTGSPERIGQIFQNLFANAIEHGNASEIHVIGEHGPNGYCLYISNNGVPIPFEIREKIFAKNFSTKLGGRGLGLAIVRKLVEAHGWRIRLTSASNTTFKICTSNFSSL